MQWRSTILLVTATALAGLLAACSTGNPSVSTNSSSAPDAPSFLFSQASLESGVLPVSTLIKTVKRSVQASTPDYGTNEWFSIPASNLSTRCSAISRKAQDIHPDTFGGYQNAGDSDGNLYGTGFFDLGKNSTVRNAINAYKNFYGTCSGKYDKLTVSKATTAAPGGYSVKIDGLDVGTKTVSTYETFAGYGNVLLIGLAPTQELSDQIVAAERKYLDGLASRQ